MSENSTESSSHKKVSKDRVPTKAKFALAATAAIATAGAAFGIFKAQEGFGNKGSSKLEPVATRSAEEAKDILLKKVDEAYAGRNIDKPEGEKYLEEAQPERFHQLAPVNHDFYHNAEGVKKMLEVCRTDGKSVTYDGREYKIEQNFQDYRAAVLLNCEDAATALKWGFMQTGDEKFKDALRNMFDIHKTALAVVKMDDPGLDDIYFNNSFEKIYKPVLGSDIAFLE